MMVSKDCCMIVLTYFSGNSVGSSSSDGATLLFSSVEELTVLSGSESIAPS